jgi:hypothetical protein
MSDILACLLALAVPILYGRWYLRWLSRRAPLSRFFKVPPLLLCGCLVLVLAVRYLVFQRAEIVGYHADTIWKWKSNVPVQIPDYAGEAWSTYVAIGSPFVALFILGLALPAAERLTQLLHFGLLLPTYAVVVGILLALMLLFRDSDKPRFTAEDTLPPLGSQAPARR